MRHRGAFQFGRTVGILLLTLILVTSLNAYFNLHILPISTIGGGGLSTNPGYPYTGSSVVKYNVQGDAGAGNVNSETIDLKVCNDPTVTGPQKDPSGLGFCSLYNVPSGNLYVPFGVVGSNFNERSCLFGICSTDFYWYATDPPNAPGSCSGVPKLQGTTCTDVRGIDLVATTAGTPILLNSATPAGDPTCTTAGGSTQAAGNGCWSTDYQTLTSYWAGHPGQPCNVGVTACLNFNTSSNMTVVAALAAVNSWCNTKTCNASNSTQVRAAIGPNYGCTTCTSDVVQTSNQNWYLYRMISDVQLQIVPPTVSVQCNPGATACPSGSCAIGCPNNGDLTNWVQNTLLPEINKMNLLTSTQINFGISVSGFAPVFAPACNSGSYANCFFGITGAWIGGQGLQYTGCPNSAYCTMVQNQHTQLGLFLDPALTQSAAVPTSADDIQLARFSNTTVASAVQNTISQFSTVYTSITTQSLGVQYTYNNNCSYQNLGQCINAPTSNLYVNAPLLFDVIGSYTSYFYQYPGVPPPGGGNGGQIIGHVCDSNKPLLPGNCTANGVGGLNSVPTACVGVNGQCSGYSGQFMAPVGADGSYALGSGNQIPPGTYAITATASGYYPLTFTGVKIQTGQTTTLDFALNSLTPPGQTCIIPPIPNPPPIPGNAYGGFCIPSWVIPAVIILAGLGLVAAIVISPAGATLIGGLGSLAAFRRRSR